MIKWLRDASIGLKVALAPAVAVVCLAGLAAVAGLSIRSLAADIHQVGGVGVQRIVAAEGLLTQLGEVHQSVYRSLAWEGVGVRAEKIKELDDRLAKELDALASTLGATAQDGGLSEAQRQAMAQVAKGFLAYAKAVKDTLDMKSAGLANAASFVVTVDAEFGKVNEGIKGFVKRELDEAEASIAAAERGAGRAQWLIVLALVLAVAVSGGLALLLTRMIATPLAYAAVRANAVADGDLRTVQEKYARDATGQVLAAMRQVSANLNAIVQDVRGTADQISTASSELASGNADLSGRTENTASALEQTAASIEELSATIKHSADNAREANALAREASTVAAEGGAVVAEVVRRMDAINTQAKKIGEIIGTIDAIAFQTNILALNAAVEAARAGEQGRGFAVVAQEVRALAGRSATASKEIRGLIASSVEQIDAGSAKVQEAGSTMGRIVGAIQQVSRMVDDIARAASEQAGGIAQVNQAVAEMDKSTQQNAAMVEQATAATESLKTQAEHLVHSLARFRT